MKTRADHSGRTRTALLACLAISAMALTACGGSSTTAAPKVATISTEPAEGGVPATSTAPADRNQALLDFAKCMRDNGVDMADPTFDADGNVRGGGFGAPPAAGGGTGDANSTFNPQSEEFQTAIGACGELIEGVGFGGAGRTGGPDREGIQNALNDFTACLRDNGQDVDDIQFGPQGGAGGQGGGGGQGGTRGQGGAGGGFGGPPGSLPANGAGPGGAGFNPVDRMIERLELDESDPAVSTALAACEPILDGAFAGNQNAPSTTAA